MEMPLTRRFFACSFAFFRVIALLSVCVITNNGDYLIPDIKMDDQPAGMIGKYGRMRKTFLKEHRSGTYNSLLLQNKLTEHLLEIDRTAREQVEQTMAQMAQTENVTEKMKAENQMLWIQRMNSIRQRAEETVLNNLIYA